MTHPRLPDFLFLSADDGDVDIVDLKELDDVFLLTGDCYACE